jgi:hypothetical protein
MVTEKVFHRIALNKWRKLSFDKLPLLESPKDGLPEL